MSNNYQQLIRDFYFGDERRHHKAVVIGFSDYHKDDPKYMVGDVCLKSARHISNALEATFATTLVDDEYMKQSSASGMKRSEAMTFEIEKLLSGSDKDDSLFIYYSMHGGIEDGRLQLFVDKDDHYDVKHLLDLARECEYKSLVLVLDCCHSGDIGDGKNGVFNNLPRGLCIITAGMPHTEVKAGSDKMLFHIPNNHGWSIDEKRDHNIEISHQDETSGKTLPYFSDFFLEALNGGAANPLGIVTIELAYQYASEAMGTNNNSQTQFADNVYNGGHARPMIKSNLDCEVPLTFVHGQLNNQDIELLNRFVEQVDLPHHQQIKFPDFANHPDSLLKMKLYSFIRTAHKKDDVMEKVHDPDVEYYLRPRGWHYWQMLQELVK